MGDFQMQIDLTGSDPPKGIIPANGTKTSADKWLPDTQSATAGLRFKVCGAAKLMFKRYFNDVLVLALPYGQDSCTRVTIFIF